MEPAIEQPVHAVDVLVVGLGPSGGAAAWAAASAGLRVLAIDKKACIGEPVQCAEFIPQPLSCYAQADGVRLQHIEGMKTFLPSGVKNASRFPGLMVDRVAFDRALARRAANVGARIEAKTRLAALDAAAGHGVYVREGRRHAIRYSVLIAADGPHSTVATLAGLPNLRTVRTRQYAVPLRRAYADTDIWLSDEFAGGYAWLFPKGSVANLGLGADSRFAPDMKAPLERLRRRLVVDGLLGDEILARTGGSIPVGGMRAALVYENILFVGDAAGLTHPITGAGIAAAIDSGERAGEAAAEFLRGDRGAFTAYDEDMRDQFGPTLARALCRRQELERTWRTPAAASDAAMRRGWIAFDEYFAA